MPFRLLCRHCAAPNFPPPPFVDEPTIKQLSLSLTEFRPLLIKRKPRQGGDIVKLLSEQVNERGSIESPQ